ncbi:HAD family hydrolase [Tetragenococcus koreensis]|uniref:Haloacid dehalogenase n=1 Tax=Tetragenococcus koreensis TaxID=290335 RepID=A0AAN4UBT8_9ENTE|nr:HAD family hydrolase [Tetragenococcus koreensis]AYW45338.1 Cof-type HAD-IIB family hydrolase [Tetragenococcus koreensis]MCF1584712.1 HAD family hydrolase [Tetragenococcus koreensis]MCF1614328.1 HAD family hydrolase [Tetragenococcus koreensis]MCF1617046.1 HAD family hydrolase [Tetragenococcus koreensis]MCF1620060.1 HAD family hydrolase [Tetragenococcus koreensis]
MNAKIVFLDVDGTLVDYHNQLPESAVEAIHKAQENGHQVYTVTGRAKAEMYDSLLAIGFDGYIGGNGSYIESQGQVVKEKTLTGEDTKQIVDWLKGRGLEFYLESNNGLFGSDNFNQRGQKTIQEYVAYKGKPDAQQATPATVFPNMIYGGTLYREDVNKISFILDSYEDFLAAQKMFPSLKVGTWGGVGEKALFGDIALKNIDKAVAIDELLNFLAKDVSNSLAFGDAKVDIPMLHHCQIGVAMGNGGNEIKKIADYITASVEDDGLYKAFEHFQLI